MKLSLSLLLWNQPWIYEPNWYSQWIWNIGGYSNKGKIKDKNVKFFLACPKQFVFCILVILLCITWFKGLQTNDFYVLLAANAQIKLCKKTKDLK